VQNGGSVGVNVSGDQIGRIHCAGGRNSERKVSTRFDFDPEMQLFTHQLPMKTVHAIRKQIDRLPTADAQFDEQCTAYEHRSDPPKRSATSHFFVFEFLETMTNRIGRDAVRLNRSSEERHVAANVTVQQPPNDCS
jgi:hypothetical protein